MGVGVRGYALSDDGSNDGDGIIVQGNVTRGLTVGKGAVPFLHVCQEMWDEWLNPDPHFALGFSRVFTIRRVRLPGYVAS